MYELTTFEWTGGFKNVPIPAIESESTGRPMIIKDLLIELKDSRTGIIKITFALHDGSENYTGQDYSRVESIIRQLGPGQYSQTKGKYDLTILSKGQPIVEIMMQKYLALMHACGVSQIPTPRIITENFTGRYPNDDGKSSGIPYGKYLMDLFKSGR